MANSTSTMKIKTSLPQLAKMIDHSLLHPTMTDAEIIEGIAIAKRYNVATVCIKPYLIPLTKRELGNNDDQNGSNQDVRICPVVGFPHGNSTTAIKVREAEEAVREASTTTTSTGGRGPVEIDMVINIGKALGQDWEYVQREIQQVNDVVTSQGRGILKVIFENDYLGSKEIVKLCQICTEVGVAFVKTSTGYGFVKGDDGRYGYLGATAEHLRLMRQYSGDKVQIKAAGGVRTLDDLLFVMSLGVTRVGATATVGILEEAKKRGIGNEVVEVEVKKSANGSSGNGGGAY